MTLLKPRAWRENAGLWIGAFTVLGLLMTTQDVISIGLWSGKAHVPDLLASRLSQAYATLLTSVLAWSAARVVRTTAVAWPVKVLVHLMVFVAFAVLSVFMASLARYVLDSQLRAAYTFFDLYLASSERSVSFMGLLYSLVTFSESLAASLAAERQRALENVDLRGRLSEARLEALRLQLQPHFLFNTLHAASALVESKPASARRILIDLGDLLRASLERGLEHEVPLRRELDLLERYLDIQRVRFGDRLSFRVDAPDEVLDLAVPAMLLQPLVENAIRHGLADRPGAGIVVVECAQLASNLRVTVTDDGRGLSEGLLREGVGLGNTRARLTGLYGGLGGIDIEPRPGGGTVVTLHFPARRFDSSNSKTIKKSNLNAD